MAAPNLQPEQVAFLSRAVAEYIRDQRELYRPGAIPLSETQRAAIAGFFTADVLNTSIVLLRNERVANPAFYPQLKAMGFDNLPDQSAMSAITFSDTVVFQEPLTNGVLFHELVHVEQYCQLGVERFAQFYVSGFLNGGCYDRIPLEVHAYELGRLYEANPQTLFSVSASVSEWIRRQAY